MNRIREQFLFLPKRGETVPCVFCQWHDQPRMTTVYAPRFERRPILCENCLAMVKEYGLEWLKEEATLRAAELQRFADSIDPAADVLIVETEATA